MRRAGAGVGIVAVVLGTLAGFAAASSTQDIKIEGSSAFLEGKFNGAGLNGSGELSPGWQSSNTAAVDEAAYLVSSSPHKNRIYFGAGYPASIVSYDGKSASVIAKFPGDYSVTALASDDRHLFAALLPSAAIVKVDDRGNTAPLVDFSTGSSATTNYIWAMTVYRGDLYAALGGHFPSVYRINLKTGKKELVYRLEGKAKNITALYVSDAGIFFGDDIGRVFRQSPGADRPQVLYAFSDAEVRSIAEMDKGLVVAVNSRRLGSSPPPPPPPQVKDSQKPPEDRGDEGGDFESGTDLKKAVEDLESKLVTQIAGTPAKEETPDMKPQSFDAKPAPPLPPVKSESPAAQPPAIPAAYQDPFGKGEGNVFWMSMDGMIVYRLWYSPSSIVLSLAPDGDNVWAATSNPARLYRISKDESERLFYESTSKDLSIVNFLGKQLIVGASNPASVSTLSAASPGEYVSKVYDAGFPGKVGRIEVTGSGGDHGDLLMRSGATSDVDSGWTDFRPAGAAPQAVGRFFQIKYRLKSLSETIRRIRIPYRVQNQPTRLINLSADVVRSQDGSPDQKDIRFQWDVTNLDNDALQYQLFYQPPGSKTLLPVFDAADQPRSVKTVNLPSEQFSDGVYRFRLTVTDEPANGASEALNHSMDFPLILLDRTPPVVELKRDGAEIRWQATDAASRVTRAEYRTDGGSWMSVVPDDGLFDSGQESGRIALPAAAAVLDFRSFDERENSRIYSINLK